MRAPINKICRKTLNGYVEDAFPSIYNGMCEFSFSNGSFSFIDLIDYVLEVTGRAQIDISTWVASTASTKKIEEFFEDAKINQFRFLIDKMFIHKQEKLFNHIVKVYGVDKIRVTRNHAKFCLIYNDDWNIVIETSANLNKNMRLENFRLTDNSVYREFFSSVFDTYFSCKSDKYQIQLSEALS